MCLRFSQISNPVWSDRQVNKWSIELKLMFNCQLFVIAAFWRIRVKDTDTYQRYNIFFDLGAWSSQWVNIAVDNFQKDLSLILCRKTLSQLVSEDVSLQSKELWRTLPVFLTTPRTSTPSWSPGRTPGRRTSSWPWEARGLPPRTKDVRSEAMLAVQCLMLPGSLAVNRRCDNGCVASGFYN